MDLSLYSGTFGFQKGGVGTSGGTVIVGNAEMAGYPYEPVQFGKRNQGRTDSGARFCYEHWSGKHRWPLPFKAETRETTAMMASFFNSPATFFFNPNPGQSQWYEVWCTDEEWHPRETYIDLFSFDVTIEET